jgi:hypothetical protein
MNCATEKCPREAVLVAHWPGKDSTLCLPCAVVAYKVAEVMGFELQASPLVVAERKAAQAVSESMTQPELRYTGELKKSW